MIFYNYLFLLGLVLRIYQPSNLPLSRIPSPNPGKHFLGNTKCQ